jgi:hypothetical protein
MLPKTMRAQNIPGNTGDVLCSCQIRMNRYIAIY